MKSRKQIWILFFIFIFSLILWNIPYINWILFPFNLFATFVHEFGHCIMVILTGGKVNNLQVFLDGSGLTTYCGGWSFFIAPAGYLGSTLVGALLLILASEDNIKVPRYSLWMVELVMLASIIFFIRDIFTFIMTILYMGVVWFIITKASDLICRYFLGFLAIQCCFYSLININTVFGLSWNHSQYNDAIAMQEMTFIPAPIWAISWALISFIVFGLVMKFIYKSS